MWSYTRSLSPVDKIGDRIIWRAIPSSRERFAMNKIKRVWPWIWAAICVAFIHAGGGTLTAACEDYAPAQEWSRNCSGTYWCESAACYSCPGCSVNCNCAASSCWCDSWYIMINVCWTSSCEVIGRQSAPAGEVEVGDRLSDPYYLASLGIDGESNVRSPCFRHGAPEASASPRGRS